ncbi:energy-coupling factor transporter transmembrane component T family protein [Caviibacter abscessus]|uniref:energy-coupling factor transporter transmembrane component T family protein n=1 Tax=Caviibacter abscessus TaxID=1766719 RepID=UPI00082EAB9D|nr:energy-coupling factor transporter transmembrane component T [Caviibacter abscessus]
MRIFGYEYKKTFIHDLNGVTKLVIFLLWSTLGMLTYNTYVLFFMLISSLIVLYISKIKYKDVSFVFWVILIFLILNTVTIYIFSPQEGVKIYHSMTKITNFGNIYDLTLEQVFYEVNVFLKYMVVAPVALIFISTTDPSELGSSLNRIGVPYSICYAINIAFRYIPDIQQDFYNIKNTKEARGIELSSKQNLLKRITNTIPILFPLIFTSIERIENISTAMELRGFGKKNKRTWYSYRELRLSDYISIIVTLIIVIFCLYITFKDGSRFYNPFMR